MQKHSSLVANAPTAHIFYHPTIDINSQHPHLLGFDSNLVPNSSILPISAVSWRGFRIFGTIWEICMYFSVSSWEYPEYSGNSLDWFYFSYRIQQGPLEIPDTSIICWTPEWITWILERIVKRSSEMAKIAIPVQEISENLEQSLYCVRW